MAKKSNPASEPLVPGGAPAPRDKRKHSPAKHTIKTASESTPSSLSAPVAATVESAPVAAERTPTSESQPSFDDIARLAYSYWEARGYQGGSQEEDWLHAEEELRRGLVASSKA